MRLFPLAGFLVVLLMDSLGGCAAAPTKDSHALEQNLPEATDKASRASENLLGPGDVLEIEVYKEPECSGEFMLDQKGMFLFCYVGPIMAAGKTRPEFEVFLTRILAKDYLRNPRVTVTIKRSGGLSQGEGWTKDSIRIIGEVNSPGIYPLKAGYTVLDVILDAGGYSDFASPNRTRIVRGEGENKEVIIVKVKDLMKSGDRAKDVPLQVGDTIIIPEAIL